MWLFESQNRELRLQREQAEIENRESSGSAGQRQPQVLKVVAGGRRAGTEQPRERRTGREQGGAECWESRRPEKDGGEPQKGVATCKSCRRELGEPAKEGAATRREICRPQVSRRPPPLPISSSIRSLSNECLSGLPWTQNLARQRHGVASPTPKRRHGRPKRRLTGKADALLLNLRRCRRLT